MTIAIMSAMHEENASLVAAMNIHDEQQLGARTYYRGTLCGRDVVVVFSHWGKVAAAITATTLICRYDVSEIVFTGVAGALDPSLRIGDIVVGGQLYQHDMDARPIIARHEIPLLGRAAIGTSPAQQQQLVMAAGTFLQEDFNDKVGADSAAAFGISVPRVVTADIASGDQFVSDVSVAGDIRERLPGVTCVEMEGAAVAQVCESFGVAFALVRTISDGANDASEMDFQAFIAQVARQYSLGIVQRYLA
ncbi:MAG: 5'-methylthioadenosine/adenosylhomocysteine nucleosidase [Pseudomonadota bacterium]